MFRLLRILFYGWPSQEECSAAGEINEILFEQRNKSYGAYQLRQSESWYLLTAMSLTTGIVGSLLLGWIWWAPIKSAKAPAPMEIPRCRFFSPLIPVASVPATPSPNAHPYRKGEGEVKISKFVLQPPNPSPLVPHYGEGIGRARGDERDGWLLPDLPGDDENIPEIEFRNVHYLEIDTLPYPGEIIIPKIEDEEIPEVKQNLNAERIPDVIACYFVDEAARPINLADLKAQIPILNTTYPTRLYLLSCKTNKRGEYVAHIWITEGPAYIREQIDPYLAALRFVPKIQDGRPREAELLISLEIPDLVSYWVMALP